MPLRFETFFAQHPRVAVALSGGCDSSVVTALARAYGCEVHAYFANTAFLAGFERACATRVCAECGALLHVIELDMLADAQLCANDAQRCYYCKRKIFSSIRDAMQNEGLKVLLDGTNASDNPRHRPGFKALGEFDVISPLRLMGLQKDDVRALGRQLGVSTADLRSFSCLAVHVPAGLALTHVSLEKARKKLGGIGEHSIKEGEHVDG